MKQVDYIAGFLQEIDMLIGDNPLSASAYLDIAELAPKLSKENLQPIINRMSAGTSSDEASFPHRAQVMMAIAHRIANRGQ